MPDAELGRFLSSEYDGDGRAEGHAHFGRCNRSDTIVDAIRIPWVWAMLPLRSARRTSPARGSTGLGIQLVLDAQRKG